MAKETSIAAPSPPGVPRDVDPGDRIFFWTLKGAGILVLALFFCLLVYLARASLPAFRQFGIGFLFSSQWNPVKDEFGALPLVYGTLVSSFIALLIAAPVSIGTALFLTELAPRSIRGPVGFLVEMLAAIPSVVYGLWGLFVLAPLARTTIQPWLGKTLGFLPLFDGPPLGLGLLTASLVLAIMITPTITALSREVFRSIPDLLREGALALGATRWEMIRHAVLKSGRSGLIGAIILGLGRALGETMAVTMLIGNRPEISASLFKPSATMASVIANEYAEAGSDLHLSSLSAVGLVLFIVSLVVNIGARVVINRVDARRHAR